MSRLSRAMTSLFVCLLVLASAASVAGAPDAKAKTVKPPDRVTLAYTGDETYEPYFWAFHREFMSAVHRKGKSTQGHPLGIALGKDEEGHDAKDGSMLLMAFVRYQGDDALLDSLSLLRPIAFLGEGFNAFATNHDFAVGWWGLFGPPTMSPDMAAMYESAAATVVKGPKIWKWYEHMGGRVKIAKLPHPELIRPPTAVVLRATLLDPPTTPRPLALEASASRTFEVAAGAKERAITTFNRYRKFESISITSIFTASLAGSMSGADSTAFLTPMLQTMQLAMNGSSTTGAGAGSPIGSFMQALHGNQATSSSLMQVLQDANASQNPALAPLMQVLENSGSAARPGSVMQALAISGSATGTAGSPYAPLVDILQKANASQNPTLAPVLQALQKANP